MPTIHTAISPAPTAADDPATAAAAALALAHAPVPMRSVFATAYMILAPRIPSATAGPPSVAGASTAGSSGDGDAVGSGADDAAAYAKFAERFAAISAASAAL